MSGFFGISLQIDADLEDGTVLKVNGFGEDRLIVGTHTTYVDSTIRQICIDVFGKSFLKQLKLYKPTSDEVLTALGYFRKAKTVPNMTEDERLEIQRQYERNRSSGSSDKP